MEEKHVTHYGHGYFVSPGDRKGWFNIVAALDEAGAKGPGIIIARVNTAKWHISPEQAEINAREIAAILSRALTHAHDSAKRDEEISNV